MRTVSTPRTKSIRGVERSTAPGRPGNRRETRDHGVIRRWTEARNGYPAIVVAAAEGPIGGLRLDFDAPGASWDRMLERISWDDFFRMFDERKLVFVYQETTRTGKVSRYFKLEPRG